MEQNEGREERKYDGIWLMIISACMLALLLMLGCRRGDEFSEATARSAGKWVSVDIAEPATGTAVDTAPGSATPSPRVVSGPRYHDRIHVNMIGNLREVFNDSNKYQYAAAERLGIRPLNTLASAYFTSRPVIRVQSNKYYTIDSLTHSFPYLVPEAATLLSDIGKNFIDSLGRRGADSYRILVTSLLRTPHHVKKLRRINRNAVDSSTHQFGTTFDISFVRFDNTDSTRTINEGDLKNLLAEVLLDLRNRNRCLVKYEHKGGCFHITVN